ncbi:hypothetical protein [Methylomonas fluvii]|uniref:DUF7847 domain-containing protein n=1 Tax=Methylomonas fluvii TaxID=1854564 RepID=A0ABR9D8G3_9GAMM|nr:hypothetical protein [Methylomonas fluvii]MBD9359399.1 hypothetical protein [Methylomonas fluvii]
MRLLATEPASIAKILDASIKLYSACFSRLWGIFSILAALFIATSLITLQLQPSPSTPPTEAMAFPGEHLPLLGFLIVIIALTFVPYAALIYRMDNVINEREDSFSEAITAGFRAFPSTFLAAFLYMVAIIVGYILLLVPGLILTLSLMFYLYFIVIDGLGGYRALRASHSLVWGHWWRTATIFTVPMVIWMAVLFAMGFLMAFLATADNQVLMQILMNLLSVFFMPYFFALGYVQFHDLKLRKSGSDLASRLGR